MHTESIDHQPVVARLADFDARSGSWPERLLFNNRPWVVALCALLTVLLAWQATRLALQRSEH